MMTGLGDLDSIRQACEAGATDFVVKPPSWPILVQHLRHTRRAHLVARELAEASARLTCEIDDRRSAETALRESEERLRLALMAANQGLYDFNTQTGETAVSPEYARMLGYQPEELAETNAKFRERLHDDDRDAVRRAFKGHIADGRSGC